MEASSNSPESAFVSGHKNDAADLELVRLAKKGSQLHFEKLCRRYHGIINFVISGYYLPNGERQDLYQEGLIGLSKAVRDYNGSIPFFHFAKLCITRQVLTAVKMATYQKHTLLNRANSLYDQVSETDDTLLHELVSGSSPESFDRVVTRERLQIVAEAVKRLTPYEAVVLKRHVCGFSYQEIAQQLGVEPKSIDNALNRARSKVKTFLEAYDQGLSAKEMAGLTAKGKPRQKKTGPGHLVLTAISENGGRIEAGECKTAVAHVQSLVDLPDTSVANAIRNLRREGLISTVIQCRRTTVIRITDQGVAYLNE